MQLRVCLTWIVPKLVCSDHSSFESFRVVSTTPYCLSFATDCVNDLAIFSRLFCNPRTCYGGCVISFFFSFRFYPSRYARYIVSYVFFSSSRHKSQSTMGFSFHNSLLSPSTAACTTSKKCFFVSNWKLVPAIMSPPGGVIRFRLTSWGLRLHQVYSWGLFWDCSDAPRPCESPPIEQV